MGIVTKYFHLNLMQQLLYDCYTHFLHMNRVFMISGFLDIFLQASWKFPPELCAAVPTNSVKHNPIGLELGDWAASSCTALGWVWVDWEF